MNDLDVILAGLSNENEEERRQAVKKLGSLRDEEHLPRLVEAMGDSSWRVRKEAAAAVISYDHQKLVDLLLPGLRDEANAGRRNIVVEVFIRLGQKIIPEISKLIKDEDPDVRKFTVDILGGIEGPETIPLLVGTLKDKNENVVAAAAEYLGLKGDSRATEPLLKILKRESFWLRFCALRAIGQLAHREQEEEVIQFLSDPTLRIEAIDILSRIGGIPSFENLVDWYGRSGVRERSKIMAALADILSRLAREEDSSVGVLVNKVHDEGLSEEFEGYLCRTIAEGGAERRSAAIRVSALFPSKKGMEALLEIIEESSEDDRETIAQSLSFFPEEEIANLLPYLLADSTIVRRTVAGVFGRRKYAMALPRLMPLINDEDGHVRASIAAALGHISDKSAIMPLYELLDDPYEDVRLAAVRSLTEMASQDEGIKKIISEYVVSTVDSREDSVTESAIHLLGNMADPSMVPCFARFLKDPRPKIRRAALNGLGRIMTNEGLDMITTALADEDPEIRLEAVRYLGQSAQKKYIEALLAMVGDEDDLVAAEALRALGSFPDERTLGVLKRGVAQPSGLKQLAAVKALCTMGGAMETEILIGLLPSSSSEVRKEIINHLGATGDRQNLPILHKCLDDEDWSIRLAAVEAIGRTGDQGSLRILKDKYYPKERDLLVRRTMERMLKAED